MQTLNFMDSSYRTYLQILLTGGAAVISEITYLICERNSLRFTKSTETNLFQKAILSALHMKKNMLCFGKKEWCGYLNGFVVKRHLNPPKLDRSREAIQKRLMRMLHAVVENFNVFVKSAMSLDYNKSFWKFILV